VAQDAALVAWLQLDQLRDAERFGAWLAGIGRVRPGNATPSCCSISPTCRKPTSPHACVRAKGQ
jgi:hypothetical protein